MVYGAEFFFFALIYLNDSECIFHDTGNIYCLVENGIYIWGKSIFRHNVIKIMFLEQKVTFLSELTLALYPTQN
jgi:hypothetical protein